MKKLLLSALGILLFMSVSSLNAYNNQWSDNEDYVVPSELNVEPAEGSENEEMKGDEICPLERTTSPVYIRSGHFTWSTTDIVLPGKPGLFFSRSYTSKDPISGMYGNGWISNLESGFIETIKYVNNDGSIETHYVYRQEDGIRYTFKDVNGTIELPSGMRYEIEKLSTTSFKVTDVNGVVDVYSNDLIISKEDIHGNKREYVYDENSQLQSIKDGNNSAITLTYGANGYVTAMTDQNARTWSYSYDGDGNLISVTDPLNGVLNYTYEKYQADNDAQFYFHLTKITDETDVSIVEVVYNKDITGTYAFQNGRVKSYTRGEDTYTYDWNYLFSTYYEPYVQKTDSLGNWNKFYLTDSGHVKKNIDSYNKSTIYNVDENMTFSGATDKMGNDWNQSLDEEGRIISTSTPLGSVTTYKYEGDKIDPSEITSPLGRATKISYDENKNPTMVTLADSSTYKASYDAKGNLLSTTNPSGIKTSARTYNENSQPITIANALGDTYSITYNALAQATSITDAQGNTATYTYNVLGYLTKTVNSMNHEIVYTYDKAGRLLSLKDPTGNVTSYEYDEFGRVSKVTRPNGRTLTYAYNTGNLVTSLVDSVGRETSFIYDSLKRITKVTVDSFYVNYTYDATGRVTQAYNSESGQYVYFTYNADGRIIQEKQYGKAVDYTYDLDGNLATMSANGSTLTYSRNSLGELESLSDGTDTFGFTYDANGMRKAISYPNGVDATYTLDNASQLVALDDGLSQNDYTYNKNGMLTQKTVNNNVTDYDYDAAGRLTEAGVESYSYSAAGNTLNNSAIYASATNQLTSTSTHSYVYDAFGNLSKKIKKADNSYKEYSWTVWNQLRSVESFTSAALSTKKIQFTYGPMGRRLSKTVDGVMERYLYSGQNMIAIMNSSSTLTHRIIHDERVDSPLSIIDASGNRYYYHKDYLGSVVGLSDATGNGIENYSYDAYGQTVKSSSVDTGNPFAFTAREMDDDDLYYYRARYYDPSIGRFLSEDPLGFSSGDFNWYRYVSNNPINYFDPYGFEGFWSGVWSATKFAGATVVTGAVIFGGAVILTAKGVGVATVIGVSTPALIISTVVVGGALTIYSWSDSGMSKEVLKYRNLEIKYRKLYKKAMDCGDLDNAIKYDALAKEATAKKLELLKGHIKKSHGKSTFAPPGM